MNRGLLLRAFRESWLTTLGFGLVVLGVEAALTFVLTKFGAQISEQMLDFERRIIQPTRCVADLDPDSATLRIAPRHEHALRALITLRS